MTKTATCCPRASPFTAAPSAARSTRTRTAAARPAAPASPAEILERKIGEVLGTIGDGFLGLLQATLGKILDGIIELVTMAFDKLTQLVDLFGSFSDALGVLWTWLPSEVMLVLVAGVTVFVFIALLKLFLK